MKQFFFFLTFFTLCFFTVKGQFVIQGKITDTSDVALYSASVVILKQADSSVVGFGLSDTEGKYEIDLDEKGEYLIQYSFIGFESIINPIESLWKEKEIQLPLIKMATAEFQLSTVNIIADRIPIQAKGDTLIYDALAFESRNGDDVEKLLEQLPGISLDGDGNLIAQGKKVNKVLVNGKEFFGDELKAATKNLDAEAVSKVEVFDKESENAEFTGVADGNESRTINLQLKEEYKKGGFGKAEALIGTDKTYSGQLNYNRFSPSTQSSILSSANNINQNTSLSGSNLGLLQGSNLGGEGITNHYSSRFNISHEVNQDLEVNLNYSIQKTNTTIEKKIESQNFTNNSEYETDENINNESITTRHQLNTRLKWKVDSFTELSILNNLSFSNRSVENLSRTIYTPSTSNGNLVTSNLNEENERFNFNGNASLQRRFRKKGRSWLNNFVYNREAKEEETDLISQTFTEDLSQLQSFDENGIRNRFNSIYTEPLHEKWFASIEYTYAFEKNTPSRSFFDRENENLIFNDSLSSAFERILNEHSAQFEIKRITKKLISRAGLLATETNLQSSGFSRDFSFLLPFVSFNYRINTFKNIRLNYVTRSNPPALNQLITIQNNTDPNRSYIGNSQLEPEYNHSLSLNYYQFNQKTQYSFSAGITASKVLNKITTQSTINDDFTVQTSPVNTDFYESYSFYAGIGGAVKKINLKYRLNPRLSLSSYDAFLNGEESRFNTRSLAAQFVISRDKKEKWDISFGLDYSINISEFGANSDFDQRASNLVWNANGELEITKTLLLSVNYSVQRLNDVSFFEGRILHFINASLRKSFLKSKWDVFLLANDLLNQNIGLQRNSNINSLSEVSYNARRQYFMIGISKKFGR